MFSICSFLQRLGFADHHEVSAAWLAGGGKESVGCMSLLAHTQPELRAPRCFEKKLCSNTRVLQPKVLIHFL